MKRITLTVAIIVTVLTASYSQDIPMPIGDVLLKGTDSPNTGELRVQVNEKSSAIAASPRNDVLYYERGRLYNKLKMPDEALHDMNMAIELNPVQGHYYVERGAIYYNTGKFPEAIDAFTKAISLGIGPGIYAARGYVYAQMGKLDEAINDLTREKFEDAMLYIMRAYVYYELQDYERAVEDYSYLIVHDPSRSEQHYFSRAISFDKLKKHPEALADINRAIEYNPRDGRYYTILGRSYFGMSMYQETIVAYTKAIEQDPVDDVNYLMRGVAYERLGKYRETVADYTKILEINPGNSNVLVMRAILYLLQLSMPDKAIDDANRAFQIMPQDEFDKLYALRGAAYSLKGKYRQALADINRAMEFHPGDANYFVARAEIYEEMAKRALRKSVKNEYLNRAKRDYAEAESIRNAGSE